MDAIDQLKQDLRDGRIDIDRLIDIIVTLQRQLEAAKQHIEELKKLRTIYKGQNVKGSHGPLVVMKPPTPEGNDLHRACCHHTHTRITAYGFVARTVRHPPPPTTWALLYIPIRTTAQSVFGM